MLKILYAGYIGLFLAILAQFTFKICVAAGNRKIIDVDANKKLVTFACYDKQHVCACLQPFSRYTRYLR